MTHNLRRGGVGHLIYSDVTLTSTQTPDFSQFILHYHSFTMWYTKDGHTGLVNFTCHDCRLTHSVYGSHLDLRLISATDWHWSVASPRLHPRDHQTLSSAAASTVNTSRATQWVKQCITQLNVEPNAVFSPISTQENIARRHACVHIVRPSAFWPSQAPSSVCAMSARACLLAFIPWFCVFYCILASNQVGNPQEIPFTKVCSNRSLPHTPILHSECSNHGIKGQIGLSKFSLSEIHKKSLPHHYLDQPQPYMSFVLNSS